MSRDGAAREPEPQERDALTQDDRGGEEEQRALLARDPDAARGADVVDETVIGAPGFFIWALTFSAGLSGLLFGYDTGVISAALVSIGTDLSERQLTTLDKSLITSSTSFFALLASPLTGILADVFGRKKVLLVADALFILGATWQAESQRVVDMIIGRSLVGVAVGAASFVAPLYISELAPSHFRGRMVTILCLMITGGQVIAYILGWLLSTDEQGWRPMVGLGTLPALLQVLVLLFLPETPRWLVKAGKTEDARKVLKRVYGVSERHASSLKQRELLVERVLSAVGQEIKEEKQALQSNVACSYAKGETASSWSRATNTLSRLLRVGGNRRALFMTCMLQGAQQLSGFNSLMYFSATIFALVGFRSPTLTALSIACTNFVFTLVAFRAIDRIGRRRILLLSVPFMVVGLALCAVAFLFIDVHPQAADDATQQSSTATGFWPAFILISMVVYVAAYATGLGNVPWQQSEMFALPVRSLGSSLATATNWGSNTIVGLTFLPLMDLISPSGTFAMYAAICALCWALIWRIYPETAGLGLEEVGSLLRDDWGVRESIRIFADRKRDTFRND